MAINLFNRYFQGQNPLNQQQQVPPIGLGNLQGNIGLSGGNLSLGEGGGGNAMATRPFGLNTFNTMRPNPNQGGFARGIGGALSNIGGFVQNNQRFGDALAGAAILGGTPIADAFAVRETINPTSSTIGKSVGTLYNIRNNTTGQQTGEQVYSTDSVKMREIAKDPNFTLEEVGEAVPNIERGDLEKEVIYNIEDGTATFTGTRLKEHKEARFSIQSARDAIISTANNQLRQIYLAKEMINPGKKSIAGELFDTGKEKFVRGSDPASLDAYLSSLRGKNFTNVIADMKAASKSGGALGSVSETELNVFSNLDFVLDQTKLGTGDKLFNELDAMEQKLVQGVEDTIIYAELSWNKSSEYIPKEDLDRVVPISAPPPIATDRATVDNSL